MADYIVTFTRTQSCTVTIKARSSDEAQKKFSENEFNESDVQFDDCKDEFNDCERDDD